MEWDLGDVPPGEYEAVARSVRRAKAASLAGLVLAVAVFAPLALLSRAFIGTGLVVVAVWYYWYGPYHRRRVSRLYASLPRWQVRAAPCLRALPGPTIESPRGPEAGNQP